MSTALAWSVPTIVAAATVPMASASPPPAIPHDITMLGWANVTELGISEFRADFILVAGSSELPAQIRYSFLPGGAPDTVLTYIPDVQQSIDQNYGIVASVDLGGGLRELYVSARGDLGDVFPTTPTNYTLTLLVTWPDGSSSTETFPILVNPPRNNTGRPMAVNAWDFTTAGLPGYVGPNSQTGWGNVVPAGSTATLLGAKFHVDAINSGRDLPTGNDATTELYYQFVRGDTGAPASVTPQPVLVTGLPNHGPGVLGRLLTELGSFSLDDPGYYKLLVWPQSSNSNGRPRPTSAGVAWTPGVVSEGHQVGSVFWHIA